MIELRIVHRMLRRGLMLAPLILGGLALLGGGRAALSGAAGLFFSLLNLWVAGRVIGGIAENRPQLLVAAAMTAFTVGLLGLTVAAVLLKRTDAVDFTITGVVLVGVHLFLVTWEAADAFLKMPVQSDSADVRS